MIKSQQLYKSTTVMCLNLINKVVIDIIIVVVAIIIIIIIIIITSETGKNNI